MTYITGTDTSNRMYLREEVPMLKKEDFVVIKVLTEYGVYQKDIADKLGVHPKTVSRALKRGSAPVKVRKVKTSKLEPYKPTIDRLLSEEVWNAIAKALGVSLDDLVAG